MSSDKKEKPQPHVFALMRNGHEVLRGAMLNLEQIVASPDEDVSKFAASWTDFKRWQALHANMEEGIEGVKGLFKVLGDFDATFPLSARVEDHVRIHDLEHVLDAAVAAGDFNEIRTQYSIFHTQNENHLKDEEKVFMPMVQKLAKSGANLKKIMQREVLPAATKNPEEFAFFVTFAMQILEQHPGGNPRARVFAHALSHVASDLDWLVWGEHVKNGLSEILYKEIADECGFKKTKSSWL